uniref:Uncharacterized protein n=2 Tax=Rhabditophanes sp. KR3021 TaxID=114890 RepID=A0AC35TK45_9BILA
MEKNVEEYLSDLDSSLQNIVLEETILNDTRLDFILGDDSWEEESVFNRGTGDKSSSTLDFNTAYYKLSNFDEDLEEIALQSFEKCKDDSELKKIWLPLTNQSRICNKNDARIRSTS